MLCWTLDGATIWLMSQIRFSSARAFTLIELLVVVLVIGILVAAAAPSFLGQTDKAHDSAAKQNLAVAYKDAKAATITETNQGEWGSEITLAATIAIGEPHLVVEADDSGYAANEIDVSVDGQTLSLKTLSGSGQLCAMTVVENSPPSAISCGPLVTYEGLVAAASVFFSHLEVGGNAGTTVPSDVGPALVVTNDRLETGSGLAGTASAARWTVQGSGENAWLETAASVTIPRTSWAFEFWYSSSGSRTSQQRLVQFWQDANNFVDLSFFSNTGQLNFSGKLGGATISDTYIISGFSHNTPYHVIWSNDGANIFGGFTLRMYVNGALVRTKETGTFGSGASMAGAVSIGGEVTQATDGAWHGQPFGIVDEVSVQDQGVTAAEVLARYDAAS